MRGNCLYNAQNFENERIICMGMIITVDGPSGAGKGTLCYALAEKLGYAFYYSLNSSIISCAFFTISSEPTNSGTRS
ncbi:cytidylate kinase [Haemophilus influenzae]|nr:cytidylate kinase [Haemophilus influenzae]